MKTSHSCVAMYYTELIDIELALQTFRPGAADDPEGCEERGRRRGSHHQNGGTRLATAVHRVPETIRYELSSSWNVRSPRCNDSGR